ncbi:U-box domain-containing protein 25 [Apostasia shenzhenica]|uniref:U-box domain-containing protein n=1 Tax=Apostasia shenzhenica TaxID=1088818 RepID=A0A2H9ZXC4_9ASPA|nr:U-box domain-containing protein 25 [Apostasia shenzhenica]
MKMALESKELSIPHLFLCPISLDLLTDPVTLSTGQTYDRKQIEKWFSGGNITCPVTMQKLNDTSLVPNHTLRHHISRWLLSRQGMNQQIMKKKTAKLFALKAVIQSPENSQPTKLDVLQEIKVLLAECDTWQKVFLRELGFFPLLLRLLLQSPSFGSLELPELALDCILLLLPATSSHMNSVNMMKTESNLAALVLLLDQGNIKIRTGLCLLLERIASSPETQELSATLGQNSEILQILVSLLKNVSEAQSSEGAMRAISSICSLERNRDRAVREGVVDAIVFYLSNPGRQNVSVALSTMELLVDVENGKKALIESSNGIGVVVKMVFRVSFEQEESEHAVGSLLTVCSSSMEACEKAVSAGAITKLLLLLQSQCSMKPKAKARTLLKLLKSI